MKSRLAACALMVLASGCGSDPEPAGDALDASVPTDIAPAVPAAKVSGDFGDWDEFPATPAAEPAIPYNPGFRVPEPAAPPDFDAVIGRYASECPGGATSDSCRELRRQVEGVFLDALVAVGPRIKGIRRIIQFEPDMDFCLRPDFVRGVQILAEYGLTFDLCIDHRHVANSIELVRRCPGTTFILDHIGKPDIKNRRLDPWRAEIETLASFPNVWCKMSGLVTEADHQHWTKEDLKPYIEHVLACFGFERTAFGGDWPVAYQAARYEQWLDALLWALDGCAEANLRKLFRDNARTFYRLG